MELRSTQSFLALAANVDGCGPASNRQECFSSVPSSFFVLVTRRSDRPCAAQHVAAMSTLKVLGTDWLTSVQYLMPDRGSAQQAHALDRESVSLSTMDKTVRESTGRRPARDAAAVAVAAEDVVMLGVVMSREETSEHPRCNQETLPLAT